MTGEGIVPHPDFDDRILAFKDLCNGRVGLYDDNGHGTHVGERKHKSCIFLAAQLGSVPA